MADSVNSDNQAPLKKRKLIDSAVKVQSNGNALSNDEVYFSSYADVELHRTMIEDQVRTSAYKNAIFTEDLVKDKVVVDVGCGTGILSMFCAQAGAKKVYAIDASDIAVHAKKLVKANGFDEIIEVIHGKAEEIDLPEKVDVIVSEWMGYMLLFESMLPCVLHIRDKYLKPDGKLLPERASINVAMGDAGWITGYQEGTYDFWISLSHLYNLEMDMLAEEAVNKYKNTAHVHMVAQEDIGSRSAVVCDFDLYTLKATDLKALSCSFSLKSMGAIGLNCLVLWFDVIFPGGSKLSTSPDYEDTHWQNTVLPISETRLKQDDSLEGTLIIGQGTEYFRHLDISLEYSLNQGKKMFRSYRLNDDYLEN